MIVRLTVLVLLFAYVVSSTDGQQQQHQLNAQQQQQQQQPTVVNSSSPYWRRPGCYRVGHMRTISIPGCVKFNLSTNACRGYCMSYSIPNNMDLGGPSTKIEVEPIGEDANYMSPLISNIKDLSSSSGQRLPQAEEKKQVFNLRGEAVRILPDGTTTTTTTTSPRMHHPNWTNNQQSISSSERGSKFHSNLLSEASSGSGMMQAGGRQSAALSGQAASSQAMHLGISSISGGEKRDVVSVSQCCNMMETEEIVVNLRCGASENRRLVFKSAKSCECFFCKHV